MSAFNLLTILGPTASGKTSLAANLALAIDGEVISADSRQVYRGMDLGTGKDLDDYTIGEKQINYHLIDIIDAGYEYNVFEFQHDFTAAFTDITKRSKIPILCGGSGLYLDAVLKGYQLIQVPINEQLRESLSTKGLDELTAILKSYKTLHNVSDSDTVKRAIRAIEIEKYYQHNPKIETNFPEINSLIIGVNAERDERRARITERLKQRLENGMIDEVRALIEKGVKPETLIYYGLEYKFITQYILGEITYNQMFSQLNIAIHQFSKRQMTWFRRMEKQGFEINWIDSRLPMNEKIRQVLSLVKIRS